ncbi:hypothetical protein F444_02574 [Phytophthora nicotianae P1976]|uniref:Uncharacterized protein n=1 Tax=Phytophthora nicotianae P1976 TaxID=1317066 RepID=A0A081AWZ6_PHYNI|nr:hypothetical protein F444_02574 [Phytophthora nicotianae P1976]
MLLHFLATGKGYRGTGPAVLIESSPCHRFLRFYAKSSDYFPEQPLSVWISLSECVMPVGGLEAYSRGFIWQGQVWWSGVRKITLRSTRTHSALDCRLTEGVLR